MLFKTGASKQNIVKPGQYRNLIFILLILIFTAANANAKDYAPSSAKKSDSVITKKNGSTCLICR